MNTSLKTEIVNRFRAMPPKTWEGVCKSAGVSYWTVKKTVYGVIQDPRIGTLEPLARHFGIQIDYRKP